MKFLCIVHRIFILEIMLNHRSGNKKRWVMVIKITNGVFAVGAQDWHRKLFDEIIPLPDGTSYNSYLIQGKDKTALIDTVDPTMHDVLLRNLDELGIKKIDYVIANHAEQDHSGLLPEVLRRFSGVTIVCNALCKNMLKDFHNIEDSHFTVIEDKSKIDLGGKTLQFIFTPWVHWPETMCTYLIEDELLFTCDFFGSHLASNDVYATDEARVHSAAKRYYAEIMMPYAMFVRRNVDLVKTLHVKMIAPSHGPIYPKPELPIQWYEDWASEHPKNLVLLGYVSMHGSTKIMTNYFEDALKKRGIPVKKFNLVEADIGEIAIDLVDTATIVIGTPCFLIGMHPCAANMLFLTNILKPKAKYLGIITSFSWGGKVVDEVAQLTKNMHYEMLPAVLVKGLPKDADRVALDHLADTIKEKHMTL
jgi:flavorubredoxin